MTSSPTSNSPSQPTHQNSWLEATKTVAVGLGITLGFHALVAQVRYIPSESMTPTLQVGDRLIVEKLSYYIHQPQQGDTVVFRSPAQLRERNIREDMIKRIIGTPGDVVAVKAGRVYINGTLLSEPYIQESASYNFGPAKVPPGQYFLLGDNRNHSYDGHLWGFVPRSDIIGRAALRIYPLDRMGDRFSD